MANRYATKTGNWSDVTVWDGGTDLPTTGDTVRPNTYTVTIDQDITVTLLTNNASAPASAGGSFALNNNVTVNANITAYAVNCVTLSGTNNATINGTLTGGSSGSSDQCAIRKTSTGTLTITGNVLGGTGGSGYNCGLWVSATGTINITGDVRGGTAGSYPFGMRSTTSAATINITGNVEGGTGGSYPRGLMLESGGTVTINGSVTGQIS